jgi:hypothetical protein
MSSAKSRRSMPSHAGMITDLAASYIRSLDYQAALRPYPLATHARKE